MLKNSQLWVFVRRLIKSDDESWTRSLVEIAIIILVVLAIRTYVFQFFRVSGPSMCPTLNQTAEGCLSGSGEFIFVSRWRYLLDDPQRGEVVIFRPPNSTKDYYIKRIVGVPGDTVIVREGKVAVQTAKDQTPQIIEEPYLSAINRDQTRNYERETFVVPEGRYFLMGDNRRRSLDGRHCFQKVGDCDSDEDLRAFVPKENISGRAEWVLWPLGLVRTVPVADYQLP